MQLPRTAIVLSHGAELRARLVQNDGICQHLRIAVQIQLELEPTELASQKFQPAGLLVIMCADVNLRYSMRQYSTSGFLQICTAEI